MGSEPPYGQQWGYEAHGLEPEPNSAEYARRQFQMNVLTAYLEPGTLPEQSFDMVMLDNVLEHVPNPMELFKTVMSLVKPDGTLFFGVPACDWIRRWLSISYMMPARSPTFDWRTTVGKSRLTQLLQRLDIFGYPEGHVNYFSRKAIDLLCEANKAEVVLRFYNRRLQALLYPPLGITTGYYFIRKKGASRALVVASGGSRNGTNPC